MKKSIAIIGHVDHASTALTASIAASLANHKTHEIVLESNAEKVIEKLKTEEKSYKITNTVECFEKVIDLNYKSGQELRRERRKQKRK